MNSKSTALILLLIFSFSLFAQIEKLQLPSQNPDPSIFPELRFEDFSKENKIYSGSFTTVIHETNSRNTPYLIIVKEELIFPLLADLQILYNDLLNDNYSPIIISYDGNSAIELKEEIEAYYLNNSITGLTLIGDLPSAWFELQEDHNGEYVNFICDLYFSDMDGIWEDLDDNGVYDSHTGNMHPELEIGRIKADNLSHTSDTEVELLLNYLNRNHLYRTGQLETSDNALLYLDDDWQANYVNYTSYIQSIYNDITVIKQPNITTASHYLDQLITQDYEFIQLHAHSGPQSHSFFQNDHSETEVVSSTQIADINLQSFFYNLFCCSAGNFETENNLASTYLLANESGLGVIASSKSGGMLYFSDFYTQLGYDQSLGSALKFWWQLHVDVDDDFQFQRSWFYGLMIFGDPTLRLYRESSNIWYVDDEASDNGDGSIVNPLNSIQTAIELAENGDAILVNDGVYYEQLNFLGKSLKISSINGNANCVIDGNNEQTCVIFENDEPDTCLLEGFTIRNGSGGWLPADAGDGIRCFNDAYPTLKNLIITSSSGGRCAIYISDSAPKIINCEITLNETPGIYLETNSYPEIRNSKITENNGSGIYANGSTFSMFDSEISYNGSSSYSSGINISLGSCYLEGVSIHDNYASNGGGISLYNSYVTMSEENRCSIYNNSAINGYDVYRANCTGTWDVIVDTFTLEYPTNNFANPIEEYSFDILNHYLDQLDSDIYVNTNGSDENSGTSSASPFKTIQKALSLVVSNEENPNTIFLANGIYSNDSNDEIFPLTIPSHVTIQGVGSSVLEADEDTSIFITGSSEGIELKDLNLRNCRNGLISYDSNILLENISIANASLHGLYSSDSHIIIRDCTISDNHVENGSAIYAQNQSLLELWETTVEDNEAINFGAIYVQNTNLFLSGGTIRNNSCTEYGGAITSVSSELHFDEENPTSIYLNSSPLGGDIYINNPENQVHAFLDTFSVSNPTDMFVYPSSIFEYTINYSMLIQTEDDIYVSPTGDNNNTGTTPESPLKTIYQARMQTHPQAENQIIYMREGYYSPSSNQEVFPIILYSDLIFKGYENEEAILDGEFQPIFQANIHKLELENLTLTNSTKAIYSADNDLRLTNVTFEENFGLDNSAAVYIEESDAVIDSCSFINNYSRGMGSAVYCDTGTLQIINSKFRHNTSVDLGGAIFAEASDIQLIGNSLSYNDALLGGGVYLRSCQADFSLSNENSIYLNNAGMGADIYLENTPQETIILDTFSVSQPNQFHFYSNQDVNLNSSLAMLNQINGELWVSPAGDDSNSGLSESEPLRTIFSAVCRLGADPTLTNTITLASGVYSENTTGERFPIGLIPNTNIVGSGIDETMIDAGNKSRAFALFNGYNNDISNLHIINGRVWEMQNYSYNDWHGAGIYSSSSNLSLNKLRISSCKSRTASALFSYDSTILASNVQIDNNDSNYYGVLNFYDSFGTFMQSTISSNQGPNCGIALNNSEVNLINSILYDPDSVTVFFLGDHSSSNFFPVNSILDYPTFGVDCLNVDPMFSDPETDDFSLQDTSPALGTGTNEYTLNGITYEAPAFDISGNERPSPYGSNPDIGAYENELGEPLTGAGNEELISVTKLLGNYPNPFNPSTTILFSLSDKQGEKNATIDLSIYNIKGQNIKSYLILPSSQTPQNSIIWDGYDRDNNPVSSGVYLYKLRVGNRTIDTKKMLLLK